MTSRTHTTSVSAVGRVYFSTHTLRSKGQHVVV
jgi:hypothetical protein